MSILDEFFQEYNKYLMCKIIGKQLNYLKLRELAKKINETFDFVNIEEDVDDEQFIKSITKFVNEYQNLKKG